VDMTILLSKSDTQVKAKVEKSNAGREPLPVFYRLEPVTLPPLPGEEACRDGAVMVAAAAPKQDAALQGLIVTMLSEAFPNGATARDFLTSLRLDLENPKLSETKVGMALTSLHRDGQIRMEGKGKATRYLPIVSP